MIGTIHGNELRKTEAIEGHWNRLLLSMQGETVETTLMS